MASASASPEANTASVNSGPTVAITVTPATPPATPSSTPSAAPAAAAPAAVSYDRPMPSSLEINRDITWLANMRTKMAYERTAISISILSLLVIKFFPDWYGLVVGVIQMGFSVGIYFYGKAAFNRKNRETMRPRKTVEEKKGGYFHRVYLRIRGLQQDHSFLDLINTAFRGVDVVHERKLALERHKAERKAHRQNHMAKLHQEVGADSPLGVTLASMASEPNINPGQPEPKAHKANPYTVTQLELAAIRTKLANTRTWLCYLRTTIPLIGVDIAIFVLIRGDYLALGVIPMIGIVILVLVGARSWRKLKTKIANIPTPEVTAPVELELGRWRTYAANERTLLSYVRTALGWAALMIATFFLPDLSDEAKWPIFSIFGVGVIYCVVYGVYSFFLEDKGITAEQNGNMHANTRTRMANNRNFLAFVRACQPMGALMLGDLGPLQDGVRAIVARVILGAIIIAIIVFALWAWRHNDRYCKTKPSTHDLAISRTLYANSRNLMAYSRIAFACWALAIVLFITPDPSVDVVAKIVLAVGVAFLFYAPVSWIQNHGKAVIWRRDNMPRPTS